MQILRESNGFRVNISKTQLIKKIKKGDMKAIIDWMDEKKDKFYKIAWAYLQNHYDIEDIFQITIIKVYENIYSLKKEAYFETWVTSIFLNECRKTLKSNKRIKETKYLDKEDCKNEIKKQDEKIDILNALNSIDSKYRDVIILKYYSGYSQEEISEILGMPIGTVKTRIYRASKEMRRILRGEV